MDEFDEFKVTYSSGWACDNVPRNKKLQGSTNLYNKSPNTRTTVSEEYPCKNCCHAPKCNSQKLLCQEMKTHISGGRRNRTTKDVDRKPNRKLFIRFG